MLAKKYPQLKKPVNCVKRMGLIESIRYYQFHKNLAKVDERMLHEQWKEDGMAEGKAIGIVEGREEGRVEGREEEKFSIARNLLAKGSSHEFVSEITGLSLDDIAKL